MLDSLAEEVITQAKQKFGWLGKLEGKSGDGWLVADLGDVIVHLFSPDQRNFYRLEQLWDKGKILLRVQ